MKKILKPGKVAMKKFTCPKCGCGFAATYDEVEDIDYVRCPQKGCKFGGIEWAEGEPYEEQMQDAKEYIYGILLTAKPQVTTEELAEYLVAHGVTFWED